VAEVQRSTGEALTDKGNTKINEAKTCFILEKGNGRQDPTVFPNLGVKYCLSCCGDDSFVVANRVWLESQFGDLDSLRDVWMRTGIELGYTLTLNVGRYLEDREFCSRWFYPVGAGHIPGAKIGRCLSRAAYFLNLSDEQTIMSAARGSLTDNHHVPFLKEYFSRVIELAPKKLGGRPQEWSMHCAKKHEYDEGTLDFVERKYGLTRQDLRDFTVLLASVKSLPVVVKWDLLEKCLAVDA